MKNQKEKDRIIVTCGAFDPLSANDINYLKKCREKGDWLIVGIHSDFYLSEMRGGFLQTFTERRDIALELKTIDEIFNFNDRDCTVSQLLHKVKYCYPNALITYVSEEDMKNMPEGKIKGIKFETMKEE